MLRFFASGVKWEFTVFCLVQAAESGELAGFRPTDLCQLAAKPSLEQEV